MRRVLLFGILILSGCASVSELRHKDPVATFNSSRSADVAASCITSAWNAQRIGIEANGASMTRDGDKILIVSPADGYPSEVAEVEPKGTQSKVSVFAQAALDVGGRTRKRLDAAKACM